MICPKCAKRTPAIGGAKIMIADFLNPFNYEAIYVRVDNHGFCKGCLFDLKKMMAKWWRGK